VQYGSSFANRLLPAGLGALGVGYFYLRKQQFTEAAALSIVTLNNVLGFVGHVVLVAALVLVVPDRLSAGVSHLQLDWTAVIAVLVGFAVLAAAYLVLSRRVQRLADVVYRTLRQLLVYKKHKRRLLLAFGTSLLLTLLYSSSLWASGQALGAQFDVAQAVIILAVGVGVGAALPLPGGLGGAEAGLVAGLLAFGQSAETAIATAILYRLVTYWLGFAVGAAAFVICRQRRYF
jgi:undecaprenyl-diphosphatase